MKKTIYVAVFAVLALAAVALANNWRNLRAALIGDNEVPNVSTVASGDFTATINQDETEIEYELSYANLEGTVTQAHIHVGSARVNGGISAWLCSNLTSPPTPAGVQPCPAPPAQITGTIRATDVVGPAAQGIAPGEFAELIAAIRAGSTYANVHTTKFPGGEIRDQIGPGGGHRH